MQHHLQLFIFLISIYQLYIATSIIVTHIKMDRKEILDQIQSGKVFKNQDFLKKQRHFSVLFNHLVDMEVTSENIMSVKKYLTAFGFPFFIVFSNFYKKIGQFEKQLFKTNLEYVADFVQKQLGDYYFIQLQFYFMFQRKGKNKKVNIKNNFTNLFFLLAFQLSQVYLQLFHIEISQKKECRHKLQEVKTKFLELYAERENKFYNYCQTYYLKQLYRQFFENFAIFSKRRQVFTIQLQIANSNTQTGKVQRTKNNLSQNFFSFQTFKIGQKPNQELIFQDILENHAIVTKQSQTLPCCRKFFVLHQFLKFPKSKILQFSNFAFPVGQKAQYTILQHICAILNEGGGTFLIGINDYSSIKKGGIIKGLTINEDLKKSINEWKTAIFSRFYPSLKKSYLQFVPVKIKEFGQFLPGQFVLRFKLINENKKQLYSFSHKAKDIFCMRQNNQTKILQGRNLLNKYLQEGKNHEKTHQGSCKLPEKGLLLYQKNITFEAYGRACREFLIDGFKEKEISSTFESLNIHKGISIFHKGQYHSLILIEDDVNFNKIHQIFDKINKLKDKNVFPVFKNIEISNDLATRAKAELNQFSIFFVVIPLQKTRVLKFKTIHDACSAFLLLKEFNIECQFSIK